MIHIQMIFFFFFKIILSANKANSLQQCFIFKSSGNSINPWLRYRLTWFLPQGLFTGFALQPVQGAAWDFPCGLCTWLLLQSVHMAGGVFLAVCTHGCPELSLWSVHVTAWCLLSWSMHRAGPCLLCDPGI